MSAVERWVDDLDKLREVKIDRCFKPKGFGKVQETQLHLFSDASREGYSAAAYLRLKDVTGKTRCSFVIGKARLAPFKELGQQERLLDRFHLCVEIYP